MILCLDVGNTQIYGGIFENDKLVFQFRKISRAGSSADEYGIFLKGVLKENNFDPSKIDQIAICTVVPDVIYSLRNCCIRYFNITPFLLEPGTKSGLKIGYRNPLEVGADRIANAIAGIKKYPDEDLIIIDFGTATTFCAIKKNREYLGGSIIPGVKISMEALEENTSKLPTVEIVNPGSVCGRSTVESIQSGLYFGNLGMIKEISYRITKECFPSSRPIVIGTGGFARLYQDQDLFDHIIPDLVLQGLNQSLKLNS